MLLTKLNKQYGTKDDKYAIGTLALIVSSLSSSLISAVAHNNYLMMLIPALFFTVVCVQNGITHSEHKRIIEENGKDLMELKKIIDSGKLSSKSSKFKIERKEDEYYVWYKLRISKGFPLILSLEYDKEKKEISGSYGNYKNIKRYFEKESEEILESLKCMILERENRRGSMIEHLESMEEEVKHQDQIIQKIQNVITKSHAIAKRNEHLLSVEEKHTLVSSIPSDANELKDVYLSFSDESKESNKDYIKETLSILEKRIMFIEMNMEKIKQEKLHVIKEKILKKHSS
jgi:chaperonin cofactor prefoldin